MDLIEVTKAFDRCTSALDDLERLLKPAAWVRADSWRALGWPVVDRGAHAIVPLARAAEGADATTRLAELAEKLRVHWGFRFGGHDFRFGRFSDTDEGAERVLGARLTELGARRPFWSQTGDHIVIFVAVPRHGEELSDLALLVVPAEWIRLGNTLSLKTKRELSRARTVERQAAAADLTWDVPDLAAEQGGLWVTGRLGR